MSLVQRGNNHSVGARSARVVSCIAGGQGGKDGEPSYVIELPKAHTQKDQRKKSVTDWYEGSCPWSLKRHRVGLRGSKSKGPVSRLFKNR